MARQDTLLESAGAEFLVLGHLLMEGIQAFKAYTNFPGYDIIAANSEKNTSCRIQVKSRWKTNYDGFIIKNFDCDFVVLVALNRGYRPSRNTKDGKNGRKAPELYVFPVEIVRAAHKPSSTWGKVLNSSFENRELYFENWGLVREFLGFESSQVIPHEDEEGED